MTAETVDPTIEEPDKTGGGGTDGQGEGNGAPTGGSVTAAPMGQGEGNRPTN